MALSFLNSGHHCLLLLCARVTQQTISLCPEYPMGSKGVPFPGHLALPTLSLLEQGPLP